MAMTLQHRRAAAEGFLGETLCAVCGNAVIRYGRNTSTTGHSVRRLDGGRYGCHGCAYPEGKQVTDISREADLIQAGELPAPSANYQDRRGGRLVGAPPPALTAADMSAGMAGESAASRPGTRRAWLEYGRRLGGQSTE